MVEPMCSGTDLPVILAPEDLASFGLQWHTHCTHIHSHTIGTILNMGMGTMFLTIFSISVPGFVIKPGYPNDAGRPWANHSHPDALTGPLLKLSLNTVLFLFPSSLLFHFLSQTICTSISPH